MFWAYRKLELYKLELAANERAHANMGGKTGGKRLEEAHNRLGVRSDIRRRVDFFCSLVCFGACICLAAVDSVTSGAGRASWAAHSWKDCFDPTIVQFYFNSTLFTSFTLRGRGVFGFVVPCYSILTFMLHLLTLVFIHKNLCWECVGLWKICWILVQW